MPAGAPIGSATMCWSPGTAAAKPDERCKRALSLVSASSVVTVLLVDPEEDADIDLAEDLVAHLGRHGLRARTQVIRHDLGIIAVSDTILTQVAELDADLLVMGAYSRSRSAKSSSAASPETFYGI